MAPNGTPTRDRVQMTARPDHHRESVTIPRSEYEALQAMASTLATTLLSHAGAHPRGHAVGPQITNFCLHTCSL